MTLYQHAKQLAESLGAKLETPEYSPTDRMYTVQAVAPDNKQWASGQCIHMVCE